MYWPGVLPNMLPEIVAGGSSDQTGWQFVLDQDSMHVEKSLVGRFLLDPSEETQLFTADPAEYRASLKSDPLFAHEPEALFSASGSGFVNGLVQNYANVLKPSGFIDYTPASVGSVKVRDWLLAKGFPARSRPMGLTRISAPGWVNFNMASDDAQATDVGLRLHGWPRNNPSTYYNGVPEWRHNDFKDVAYTYVQELYKTWVELTK